jgi:hypothetical protein
MYQKRPSTNFTMRRQKECLSRVKAVSDGCYRIPDGRSYLPATVAGRYDRRNIATETTTLFVSPITVPVSPNPVGSQKRWLLMGHGLAQFRFVMVLDDVVEEILEEHFQRGVEKSSNRKGVLEMVEECGKTVPELMAPSVHDVNSWLSSRLAREKKEQQYECRTHANEEKEQNGTREAARGGSRHKGGPKTSNRRQHKAASLSCQVP